mgnify:CR=1 FL=1
MRGELSTAGCSTQPLSSSSESRALVTARANGSRTHETAASAFGRSGAYRWLDMAHSPLKEGDRLLYNGSEPEWQGARGEIEEIDTVGGRPVVSARWSLARDDDDSDDDQGGVLARTAVRGSRAPRAGCGRQDAPRTSRVPPSRQCMRACSPLILHTT